MSSDDTILDASKRVELEISFASKPTNGGNGPVLTYDSTVTVDLIEGRDGEPTWRACDAHSGKRAYAKESYGPLRAAMNLLSKAVC